MAITTLDGVIAGMQPPQNVQKAVAPATVAGRLYTPFYLAGAPGAAAANAAGVNGAALTTYAGQLAFVNGAADQYLARFAGNCNVTGTLLLCDRLWHNSGLSVTSISAQAITPAAIPARDDDATTNGKGIYAGLEISTITGAGANVPQITYTDSGGTAGNLANPRLAYVAASAVGTFYDFSLAAGDVGVRSIQSYINTVSMTSGAIHLVLYRVLSRVSVQTTPGMEFAVDALTGGMPKLHNDTVPFLLWLPQGTTAPSLGGQFIQTNG